MITKIEIPEGLVLSIEAVRGEVLLHVHAESIAVARVPMRPSTAASLRTAIGDAEKQARAQLYSMGK